MLRILAAVSLIVATTCGDAKIPVVYRSTYAFSRAERDAIESVASRAASDVRELLPAIPARFSLFVATGDRVIPETGESGSASLPSGVYWTVDPQHPGGVLAIVHAQLRATLFHELYHAVRNERVQATSIQDRAIDEGLATVFERDFAAGAVPWGDYPADVAQWTAEFMALPVNASHQDWMIRHPDGRRWIGMKVGTYLVDRAIAASGRSVHSLVTTPASEIVALALHTR